MTACMCMCVCTHTQMHTGRAVNSGYITVARLFLYFTNITSMKTKFGFFFFLNHFLVHQGPTRETKPIKVNIKRFIARNRLIQL